MSSELERPEDQFKVVTDKSRPGLETSAQVETKIAEVVMEENNERKVSVEEFKISGDTLLTKVKELIRKGNIRRIIIKNEQGRTLIDIPLTIGVVGGVIGGVMFPFFLVIGAIGAVAARLTVVVERKE